MQVEEKQHFLVEKIKDEQRENYRVLCTAGASVNKSTIINQLSPCKLD